MKLAQLIFYLLVAVASSTAIGILLIRNVFHAALLLLVCLLAIAGIFVLLHAEFLAVAQLLIYAGGVLLLIIFGIMLTIRSTARQPEAGMRNFLAGSLLGISLTGLLWVSLNSLHLPPTILGDEQQVIAAFGIELMSLYVAPFELAGILLLVSLIGAMGAATIRRNL